MKPQPEASIVGSLTNENPSHTAQGQIPVSMTESFWSRLAREGKFRASPTDKAAFAATTAWNWTWYVTAEPGYIYFPKTIIVTADVDCELGVRLAMGLTNTGGTNADSNPIVGAFLKAGTPLKLEFDGEVSIMDSVGYNASPNPAVYIGVNNATVGGNIYFSVQGVEVAYND